MTTRRAERYFGRAMLPRSGYKTRTLIGAGLLSVWSACIMLALARIGTTADPGASLSDNWRSAALLLVGFLFVLESVRRRSSMAFED